MSIHPMKNPDTVCYIITAFNNLSNCESFVRLILSVRTPKFLKSGKGELFRVVKEILRNPGKMASAQKIRNLVHKAKPAQGYIHGQHDVSEFTSHFIEVLEDEFVNSFMGFSELFDTTIVKTKFCENCNNASQVEQNVTTRMHPLPVHETSLRASWETYLAPERQKVTCEKCQHRYQLVCSEVVTEPKILCLSYNRFRNTEYQNKRTGETRHITEKVEADIETPMIFNLGRKTYR